MEIAIVLVLVASMLLCGVLEHRRLEMIKKVQKLQSDLAASVSEYQDTKQVNNTAELVKEITDSIEAITLARNKSVTIIISNDLEPGKSGFIIKTKFGSS